MTLPRTAAGRQMLSYVKADWHPQDSPLTFREYVHAIEAEAAAPALDAREALAGLVATIEAHAPDGPVKYVMLTGWWYKALAALAAEQEGKE